jgi:hypothetical protein
VTCIGFVPMSANHHLPGDNLYSLASRTALAPHDCSPLPADETYGQLGRPCGIPKSRVGTLSQHPLTWPMLVSSRSDPSSPSMFSHASLTIRVLGISPPGALTTKSLEERCREFCDVSKPRRAFFRRRLKSRPRPLLVSVARQGDSDTGTVTFPSEDSKGRALESLTLAGWRVDDTFADLTVLHSAPEPDLEYACPPPVSYLVCYDSAK